MPGSRPDPNPSPLPLTDDERTQLQQAMDAVDAIRVVGRRDFEGMRPDEHTSSMPPEAGCLRRIIEGNTVNSLVQERRRVARRGGQSKARALLLFRLALALVEIAILASLLSSVAYLGLTDRQETVVSAGVFLCLLGAAFVTILIVIKSVGEIRAGTRRSAEDLRRAIFSAIIDQDEQAQPGEIAPTLLKLEYFRRFQLAAQIDHYAVRIGEQTARVDYTRVWHVLGMILLGIFVVVLLLMVVAAAGEQGYLTWAAGITAFANWLEAQALDTWFFAAVLLCLAAYVFSRCSAIQIGDHRSLYKDALAGLMAVRTRDLEPAREAAACGDPGPMRQLAERVHEIMRRENTIWLGR